MARIWEDRSPAYRARLERHGIGKEEYERGANLSAARGHANTPEHRPASLEDVPERYQSYADLRREIIDLKRQEARHAGTYTGKAWEVRRSDDLKGKSRSRLERAREILEDKVSNHIPWETLVQMYPELEDEDWEWLKYYH